MGQEEVYNESKQAEETPTKRPSGSSHTFGRCANCDIEILWLPTVVQGKHYCCSGCAAGGPCCCDYSLYHSVNISGVIHYSPEEETLKKSFDVETTS